MGKSYCHISPDSRLKIHQLLLQGWGIQEIENANRLLRTKFPKRVDIEQLDQNTIDKIVDSLNDRPMKCLSYATPKEEFFKHFGMQPLLVANRT